LQKKELKANKFVLFA